MRSLFHRRGATTRDGPSSKSDRRASTALTSTRLTGIQRPPDGRTPRPLTMERRRPGLRKSDGGRQPTTANSSVPSLREARSVSKRRHSRSCSVLIVFVDERGNALGAQGGAVTGASHASITCCKERPRSAHGPRAVRLPPRGARSSTRRRHRPRRSAPMASWYTVNRFFASAPVELAVGRYTDLDDAVSQPGGTTPVLQLTDRLVWVLIEHDSTRKIHLSRAPRTWCTSSTRTPERSSSPSTAAVPHARSNPEQRPTDAATRETAVHSPSSLRFRLP